MAPRPISLGMGCIFGLALLAVSPPIATAAETAETGAEWCGVAGTEGRTICADIAAIDQTIVYNRFGSFDPYGMIFALRRDVAPLDEAAPARPLLAADCARLTGTEAGNDGTALAAGAVRLKDCERPRPLTLRANVGDTLVVRVTNLLQQPAADFSHDFCGRSGHDDAYRAELRAGVSEGDAARVDHGEAACETGADPSLSVPEGNWPATRLVNLVAQGLTPVPLGDGAPVHGACRGTDAVGGDASFVCAYRIDREGPYFFASLAAPAGGQGDGGSLVHGLFGAVVAERAGSTWYRSQTTQAAFDAVWPRGADGAPLHSRTGALDYEAVDAAGVPYLNMLRPIGVPQTEVLRAARAEIVHGDLNAVVYCGETAPGADCRAGGDGLYQRVPGETPAQAFREFSVFFHDELKAFYTRNFEELGQLGQMTGVRDGFAINYGASGMGGVLLANRKGIGPAAGCMECLYEEFFLTSWANGDPALLERFADDPSNVHHSYLNDPVVFRNFHAGPKETHVFHLHAHQWFSGNDPNRGSYLDSQTVAPQQGFTYNIYHGGQRDPAGNGAGWWGQQGSGNRNRTIGDSIFHCHLYPHFAQGMWALWRVHDVLEDGLRRLPDGQAHEGLSLTFADRSPDFALGKRPGSVDQATGAWIAEARGTPVPALVPLPGEPLPLLPSYANGPVWGDEAPAAPADEGAAMPGYPFYVAGEAGHRPPQAPLDIARDLGPAPAGDVDDRDAAGTGGWLDGGLPRHVMLAGSAREMPFAVPPIDPAALPDAARARLLSQIVAKAFALGDLTAKPTRADIRLLDNAGTPLERAAMGFHFDGRVYDPAGGDAGPLRLIQPDGSAASFDAGSYSTTRAPVPASAAAPAPPAAAGVPGFAVNGSPPKPGAPFADPCGIPAGVAPPLRLGGGDPLHADPFDYFRDPFLTGFRRYEVSAVQLDLVVNSAGWHDPQARINVLTANSDRYKDNDPAAARISPVISDREEPFFFRALSGECIEFRHTNELPKDLALDDFQVRTPTDTVGQHIHLVKFDVTSSDGSGNGWNYEDGTFAADEIALRRCASTLGTVYGTDGTPGDHLSIGAEECVDGKPVMQDIWRHALSANRGRFQTTVQRWFADPILSPQGDGALRDRTLRTVFTHDHFGPSSIQQHGFYSALVVEPEAQFGADGAPAHGLAAVCDEGGAACYDPPDIADQLATVAFGTETMTGARKLVLMHQGQPDPLTEVHPDFREYALSVADFALLYDPRDRISEREFREQAGVWWLPDSGGGGQGMATLYCEALWRLSPALLAQFCGSGLARDAAGNWAAGDDVPPAWLAAGRPGDHAHAGDHWPDLFVQWPPAASEIAALRRHAVAYRQRAAGLPGAPFAERSLAMPVAPPARPEAISVDHHDPYLVNYRGAPIPLRVGDKVAGADHSNDCAPLAMGVPGAHGAADSAVVAALAGGDFPLCSRDRQLTGPKGDMGFALSSWLHGDPETPLLEAYQGEKIMVRLIQGAQEVQHGFRLLGHPFRRNPDQSFGRGMLPLGMSAAFAAAPTRHRACAERLASGRPEQYRKWLEEGPDAFAAAPYTAGDLAYWTEFETLLAECDNADGFTFVQEIGISEHFEIQGSLRADVDASLERRLSEGVAPAPVVAPEAGRQVPNGVADTLYDFGSVDALWNGAWGLMRIYEDTDTLEPQTAQPIGERLAALSVIGSNERRRAGFAPSPGDTIAPLRPATSGLSCPFNTAGHASAANHSTEAVVVALQTADIWPDGTGYGGPRHDPDGLMLALLPPETWPEGGLFAEDAAWGALDRQAVLDAVEAAYTAGPEPFVLRANAGDCVALRFVNLLTEVPGGGLRDLLGDARATPIAPLDLDPAYGADGEDAAGFVRRMRLDRPEAGTPAGGLRPSARLALRIGLPGMDLRRDLPMGIGYMADTMPPAAAGSVPVSPAFMFYAGRYRVNLPDPGAEQAMIDDTALGLWETGADGTLRLADPGGHPEAPRGPLVAEPVLIEAQPGEDGLFDLLGKTYVLAVDLDSGAFDLAAPGSAATAALREAICAAAAAVPDCAAAFDAFAADFAVEAARQARIALDQRTHWIPYAFGAVPVTSTADMISHTPHGLFGVIDVLPRDWALDAAASHQVVSAPADPQPRRTVRHVPAGAGLPLALTVAAGPSGGAADPGQVRLREFVLFFQDGVALRDRDARTAWVWDDTGQPVRDLPDGAPIRPVADCHVCDDSYDLGESAVNYVSVPFSQALREQTGVHLEDHDDLNLQQFPADFVPATGGAVRLMACAGEQVVIRVIHPGGRARQRAFVMNGYGYEDLFPGFGFANAALLTPGKSVSAWLTPTLREGVAIWHDGPFTRRAGGVWGMIDVKAPGEALGEGGETCP